MSTTIEPGWQAVSTIWKSAEQRTQPAIEVLRERAKQQSKRLQLILAAEILITLIMLGLSGAVILRSAGAGAFRLSAIVLLYTAGVWAFTLWNRRGIWRPYGESTADFIALLRTRAQRRVRTARFCLGVVVIFAVPVARQMQAAIQGRVGMRVWEQGVWTAFAVYAVGMAVWSLWCVRRAKCEMRELDELAQELGTEGRRGES